MTDYIVSADTKVQFLFFSFKLIINSFEDNLILKSSARKRQTLQGYSLLWEGKRDDWAPSQPFDFVKICELVSVSVEILTELITDV